MSNPPGVSVSQIATQVEPFDQMWIELVSFPDMADGDLSACVPWQRGMGGHFYHCANRLLRNYQDIPRAGGPASILHGETQKPLLLQLHRWAGNPHFSAICRLRMPSVAIWIIRECRTNCKGRSCPWAQVDRDMYSSGQHDELWPSDSYG